MERINGRLCGQKVASREDYVLSRIEKKALELTPEDYIVVGDSLMGEELKDGEEKQFTGDYKGKQYTITVKGRVCEPNQDGSTRILAILRKVEETNSQN